MKSLFRLGLSVSPLILSGCVPTLFDSGGTTGKEIGGTILLTMGLMLIVVIPTIALSIWAPWKYHASKDNPDYDSEWDHSTKIELYAWGVPLLIVAVLSAIALPTTFTLDPREPLDSVKPVKTIQVVALDWKWLFIDPEEQIATVNEIAFPVDTPIQFLVTSATTMNSFFIPKLGGQIYAMAGMENRINLMAEETGSFRGISANYSGFGFSGMKFKAHVMESEDYRDWVDGVKESQAQLTDESFNRLMEDSRDHPVEYFGAVDPLLFKNIIESFSGVQLGSN